MNRETATIQARSDTGPARPTAFPESFFSLAAVCCIALAVACQPRPAKK